MKKLSFIFALLLLLTGVSPVLAGGPTGGDPLYDAYLSVTDSPQDFQLYGWAWSTTTGWIKMNSKNIETVHGDYVSSDGGVDYGVYYSPTNKTLSGYAWSSNVGWVSFEQSDIATCGAKTTANLQPDNALNPSKYTLSGTARVLSALQRPDQSGGWDGCIYFSKASSAVSCGATYGVEFNQSTTDKSLFVGSGRGWNAGGPAGFSCATMVPGWGGLSWIYFSGKAYFKDVTIKTPTICLNEDPTQCPIRRTCREYPNDPSCPRVTCTPGTPGCPTNGVRDCSTNPEMAGCGGNICVTNPNLPQCKRPTFPAWNRQCTGGNSVTLYWSIGNSDQSIGTSCKWTAGPASINGKSLTAAELRNGYVSIPIVPQPNTLITLTCTNPRAVVPTSSQSYNVTCTQCTDGVNNDGPTATSGPVNNYNPDYNVDIADLSCHSDFKDTGNTFDPSVDQECLVPGSNPANCGATGGIIKKSLPKIKEV